MTGQTFSLKALAVMIVGFALLFYLPLEWGRFTGAIFEALALARWYTRQHVLLCLVPAFFIAGAIAVPLLVLLYFLKLRRQTVEVSTTLLWAKAIQDLQANAPFQRLRNNILLILQLLALALILLAAAQPEHDHHRVADAGGAQALRGLDCLGGCRSLVDPGQDLVVTALGAVVDDAQSQLAQLRQVAGALAQDAARVTVDADPSHGGDPVAQPFQDADQQTGRQHQGVAVAEEDAADRFAGPAPRGGLIDVGFGDIICFNDSLWLSSCNIDI
mgnify:CR=1 FL=1